MIGLGSRGPAECVPCQVLGRQCHVECSAFPALTSAALRSLPKLAGHLCLANRLLLSRACGLPSPRQGWTGAGVMGRPGSVLSSRWRRGASSSG